MDEILRALSHSKNIKNIERFARGDELFQRKVKFQIEDQDYVIEWFPNGSYIYIGNAQVAFEKLRFYGTWPNRYKNNLQFYNEYDRIVCVIGVDKYDIDSTESA